MAAVVAAVAALVALVPAYLSVRYVNRAEERAATDVDGAFEDLDRSRSLNPAALEPDLAEGRIAIAARRYDEARQAFEHSLTVEDNWLAHFELALINTGRGRFGPAAAQLRQARALNARDPVLTRLARTSKPGGAWTRRPKTPAFRGPRQIALQRPEGELRWTGLGEISSRGSLCIGGF